MDHTSPQAKDGHSTSNEETQDSRTRENTESPQRPSILPTEPDAASINGESKGEQLDSHSRWIDAMTHAQGKVGQEAAREGRNDVKSRWKRAVFLATQLTNGRGVITGGTKYDKGSPQAKRTKALETQHWLELIDSKHRYGSNLKYYHKKWVEDDTKENFFQWLDYGGGKDLDLPECSREQLEKERIIYLSVEQRLNYLTKIDSHGKLRWAHNNEYVDTKSNCWKDAGNGQGIIATDGSEDDRHDTGLPRRQSFDTMSSLSSSDSSVAAHYAGDPSSQNPVKKLIARNLTAKGAADKLLRKTVQKNTWIYACDLDFNLFVGIKQTGVFQHSSFFAGSVLSAGLLTVNNGLVTSFSPLSGHYRTSISHFQEFVSAMDERGLDLHKVQVTKAEAILWGLEHYGKFKKAEHKFVQTKKDQIKEGLGRIKSSIFPGQQSSNKEKGKAKSHNNAPKKSSGSPNNAQEKSKAAIDRELALASKGGKAPLASEKQTETKDRDGVDPLSAKHL